MPKGTASKPRGVSTFFWAVGILLVIGIILSAKFMSTPNAPIQGVAGSGAERLAAAKGQGLPVWLVFHSNSCESCLEQMAIFEKIKPEFEGGIAFVEVDVNGPEQGLVRQYGVEYIPTNFLLDRQGKIAGKAVGLVPVDVMRSELNKLAGIGG